MIVTIYFEVDHKQKLDSAKKSIFGPQKSHFGQSGPKNGPPSGQTATYRKTKVIQSYLRIWGTYDPIEPVPSEPKKGIFIGVATLILFVQTRGRVFWRRVFCDYTYL